MNNVGHLAIALLLSVTLSSCDSTTGTDTPLPSFPGDFVDEGATWEVVVSGHPYSDSPAADADGNIYYSDVMTSRIMILGHDDQLKEFATGTALTQGLVFGPDGYLYGCRHKDAQIVRYSADGTYVVLAQGQATLRKDTILPPTQLALSAEFCNDIAVHANGGIWFTDRVNERILYMDPNGKVRTVASGFRGNGIILSIDSKMLVVTDSKKPKLHAFQAIENGTLTELRNYFDPIKVAAKKPPKTPPKKGAAIRSGANGMALDSDGRFYVPTFLGVQVFDKDGRHLGVIAGTKGYMSNLGFGGPDGRWLYTTGNSVARLRMKTHGVGFRQQQSIFMSQGHDQ